MAYRCKCQATGLIGDTDTFFRVKKGKRNIYFKDEETYIKFEEEKDARNLLVKTLAFSIFGYSSQRMLSNGLLAQIKSLNEVYTYDTLLKTVKKHIDTLKYYANLSGKYENENHRQFYILTIIKNNALDVHIEEENKRKRRVHEQQKEQSIDIDTINRATTIEDTVPTSGNVDISQFL